MSGGVTSLIYRGFNLVERLWCREAGRYGHANRIPHRLANTAQIMPNSPQIQRDTLYEFGKKRVAYHIAVLGCPIAFELRRSYGFLWEVAWYPHVPRGCGRIKEGLADV
jgi:hypothetical protein